MIRKLSKYPLYVILLPLFFVLHGFYENYGSIALVEATWLLLAYLAAFAGLFILLWILLRSAQRAALFLLPAMIIFFFYGAVQALLKSSEFFHPLSRYSILLPLMLILFFAAVILIDRRKGTYKLTRYLNLLLLIYIFVDVAGVLFQGSRDQQVQMTVSTDEAFKFTGCDSCARPDIFFLLFDEYENPVSLRHRFGQGGDIDSFLLGKGFFVATRSRSNYHYTPFSVASILNMSYIGDIPNEVALTVEDYSRVNKLIENNRTTELLESLGYTIVNYSIFDLKGSPAGVQESFLPVKTKLISDRTFVSLVIKDLGWLVTVRFPALIRRHYESYRINNEKFIQKVNVEAGNTTNAPRFIYAHFNLPHSPFFFDGRGNRRPDNDVFSELHQYKSQPYLEYVDYTNLQIKGMVDRIQRKNPSAVIVIMGDHGYRDKEKIHPPPTYFFNNLNAIYIPDSRYKHLYDSISGVNQFRMIFNEVFQQQWRPLRDSIVTLKDKN